MKSTGWDFIRDLRLIRMLGGRQKFPNNVTVCVMTCTGGSVLPLPWLAKKVQETVLCKKLSCKAQLFTEMSFKWKEESSLKHSIQRRHL